MAEKYYPSESKWTRAEQAVKNYKHIAIKKPNLVDVKLVSLGLAEGLKDEALIEFVYNGLGGKESLSGTDAKEAKQKATEAKKRAAERKNKSVERIKTTVK